MHKQASNQANFQSYAGSAIDSIFYVPVEYTIYGSANSIWWGSLRLAPITNFLIFICYNDERITIFTIMRLKLIIILVT